MKKLVVVEIEASGRYCSNNCEFMSNDAKSCELFRESLHWDYRKKINGNHRVMQCRKAERKP